MELKTLKDIEENTHWTDISYRNDNENVILIKEIKQEAIKDIKELREGILKDSYSIQCAGTQPLNENVVDYIKWKFNITEEDLE